jgi:hypothetical protein
MIYFNESLRNWLLGNNEIDGPMQPTVAPSESPQDLLSKYQKTQNAQELAKINKKLSKLGFEVKTVHILSKKSK